MLRHASIGIVLTLAVVLPALAAPELFDEPYNESPVRGGPGDLVVIAGEGFLTGDRVVYRRLTGCSNQCCQAAPTSIPGTSTANCGEATVVAQHGQALTAQLPSPVVTNEVYAFRVFRSGAAVTGEIKINDARPSWVSPSRIYVSTPVPGVQGSPRYLKVVGRNLQPRPGVQTRVRIVSGGTTIAGPLNAVVDSEPAMNHYVAQVNLPSTVSCSSPPCTYTVQVSRDNSTWVSAPNTLQVLANPAAPAEKYVGDYGCTPNNGVDDTSCVLAAINTLAANGGGTAVFGAGEWLLAGSGAAQGITLPPGVNLKGQGPTLTTLKRDPGWHTSFVFLIERGPNTIEGIRFDDDHALSTNNLCSETDPTRPCTTFIVLNNKLNGQPTTLPIEDVTITNNRFEDISYAAIGDKLFDPLSRTARRLYITNNTFEAFWTAVFFGGWGDPDDGSALAIDDAIITNNQFHPGEYSDPYLPIHQGTIATTLGAGRRLDFSGNVANERDLNNSPRGWRAAFFWHMANSHEDLLVSKNRGYCTGAVGSDGEFLAFDGNGNISGFPNMVAATDGGGTSVTVAENPAFEIGYWIQVVKGRGLGQTRKVTSCSPSCSGSGPVTINVSPEWDVKPDSTSRITAARQYWHLYQVANQVDMRQCVNQNPTEPESGRMGFHGTTADSTIEANDQWKSDGIFLGGGYGATGCYLTPGTPDFFCLYNPNGNDPSCTGCNANQVLCKNDDTGALGCTTGTYCLSGTGRVCSYPWTQFQYFNEIRGNLIDDEYAFDDVNSWSGIDVLYGAVPYAETPVLGYGNTIGYNEIIHADATRGGGIGFALGWYPGSAGATPFRSTAVHHNTISNVRRPSTGTCRDHYCYNNIGNEPGGGVGIYLQEEHAFDTVLKDNTFTNDCYAVKDFGTGTINYDTAEPSCQATQACPGPNCTAGGGCTNANSGVVHCDNASNVSFNCACSDSVPQQSTIHQETCPCNGGFSCPTTQQRLVCLVP